jgi:copper resistance protein B
VGGRGDLVVDAESEQGRGFLVIGLEGLAPYFFELEPALFVSHRGDVSLRLEGSIELFITQRLVVQPSLETNIAIQEVPEFGVGAGLNDLELELRLRYEISRKFAPYIGFSWKTTFFDTADLREAAGTDTCSVAAVAGIRCSSGVRGFSTLVGKRPRCSPRTCAPRPGIWLV